MKTIKILVLVSILAVTQSFALSKTQKNILLGLGAGAIIVHTLQSHNNNRYERPHHRVVYVDSHKKHRKHKKHMRRHHRDSHNYYSRADRHNRNYHRNNYRNNSFAVNNHNRRGHHRY